MNREEMKEIIVNLKIDIMSQEEMEQFIYSQMLINLDDFDDDVLEAIMEDLQK